MCLILNSWFGKDLGDGTMLGSTLGILLTLLKIILFAVFYYFTIDKHTFWDRDLSAQSPLTYFVYDLVILIAFIIIFIGGKKCSSALLVTGLIMLIVATVAEFLYLAVHVAAWISRGQQLQLYHQDLTTPSSYSGKWGGHARPTQGPHPDDPTVWTTMIITALFILTSMYLVYLVYFILTVASYIAHIGEVRVR